MPSIRRSLVAYLLLLFTLALAACGVLVDQFARELIKKQEQAEIGRIEIDFQQRCNDSEARFDKELLIQAQALGRELRQKYRLLGRREEMQKYGVWIASMPLGDMGSSWATATSQTAVYHQGVWWSMFWALLSTAQMDEIRHSFEGDEHPRYFQFNFSLTRSRRVIRAPALESDLPLDVDVLNRNPDFESRIDADVEVPGKGRFRRVVVRSAVGQYRGGFGGFGPGFPSPPRGRPVSSPPSVAPPEPPIRTNETVPSVYVQVARDTADLQGWLDEHRRHRDADLARLAEEIQAGLARLRGQLIIIGLLAIAALAGGGWLLVSRGLSPVHKLSDAVSRVSEKDFRLPVAQREMSVELLPIHDRLQQTLDELRRAFEREKQAVADISHELRTPVAALLTTLDVSLRKPRSAEQYRTTLEESREIGRQLAQLVERVMTLASLDAGVDRTTPSDVDVAEVAAACESVIRPLARANGLSFHADLNPVLMNTDPDKLREVIVNLLHNAIEYNRPGGKIRLSVREKDGQTEIEVVDTGIGMTPEVRERIFERFFRADPSRHEAGVHAGLGLSIVKEYVERLGGSIAVESESGVGSRFRVTLPGALATIEPEPLVPTGV